MPDAVTAHANPVRAYVTAMEGCNLVCSFCVVPRTRGPEVNRPADEIVAEVEAVVARGFREVMLLGPDRERLPLERRATSPTCSRASTRSRA